VLYLPTADVLEQSRSEFCRPACSCLNAVDACSGFNCAFEGARILRSSYASDGVLYRREKLAPFGALSRGSLVLFWIQNRATAIWAEEAGETGNIFWRTSGRVARRSRDKGVCAVSAPTKNAASLMLMPASGDACARAIDTMPCS
jgi:hypothetical protein